MASNFGISELRSKFDHWRTGRHNASVEAANGNQIESSICRIVEEPKEAFDLSLLLENLVIPKLIADRGLSANRISAQGLAETIGTDRKRPITHEDVVTFTNLTIKAEATTLLDFIDNCMATGSSIEAIYVDLLAPAARRLGEFWDADSEDFVDVTMGLWRIQEVLRELTLRVPPPSIPNQGQRSALFSTMPGEQHSLGTLMVAECFQRAGWDTDVMIEPTQSELTGKFADRHYDLIGLTISNDCPIGTLSGLIKAIKSVSSNPEICVMIGGRLANENPYLADQCGADATAADAPSAVSEADRLVPLVASAPDLLV